MTGSAPCAMGSRSSDQSLVFVCGIAAIVRTVINRPHGMARDHRVYINVLHR